MLSEYIDNRIRSLPSEIRPKQTPLLNCSTSGKIILARITKTKTKASDEGKNLTENVSLADTAIIEALEYHTDGDYTNALSCLDKALKIDPKNAKAYHYKGNILALQIDPNPKYASAVSKVLNG